MVLGKQEGRLPLMLFRISSSFAVTQGDLARAGVKECIKKWNEVLARKTTVSVILGGNGDFLGQVMSCLLEVISTLPGKYLCSDLNSVYFCFCSYSSWRI